MSKFILVMSYIKDNAMSPNEMALFLYNKGYKEITSEMVVFLSDISGYYNK